MPDFEDSEPDNIRNRNYFVVVVGNVSANWKGDNLG